MPTIFTHAVAAFSFGKTFYKQPAFKLLAAGMVCSMLPDADVIAFRFGIPYESMFGHRGFTHSFFFAFVLSAVVSTVFFRNNSSNSNFWIAWSFLFMATSSHPLLDAFTNGGLGVAFFAPFSNHRYFFPWRPLQVSPIGAENFFSNRGLQTFLSELKFVWFPGIVLIALSFLMRKKQMPGKN
jgi:inner membrane protein